jgi:hypothetical protein
LFLTVKASFSFRLIFLQNVKALTENGYGNCIPIIFINENLLLILRFAIIVNEYPLSNCKKVNVELMLNML